MILVLGGTSDSLMIGEALNKIGAPYLLSVTTEYGKSLSLNCTQNVIMGILDLAEMTKLIEKEKVNVIIDATHPYAVEVSRTAIKAAKETGISYIRYERKSLLEYVKYDKLYVCESIEEACKLAGEIGNRIFLSTGSKNLELLWNLLSNKKLVARVLPTSKVIVACEQIGFKADQIIAMKGPFSAEMNEALYRACSSDLVITKESGSEGGFLEKIEACKNLGIAVIVIKRKQIEYPCVVYEIGDVVKTYTESLA